MKENDDKSTEGKRMSNFENFTCPDTINIKIHENPDIDFIQKKTWIMKLTSQGIKFNREEFPNLCESEFAYEIIRILESCFTIKFTNTKN